MMYAFSMLWKFMSSEGFLTTLSSIGSIASIIGLFIARAIFLKQREDSDEAFRTLESNLLTLISEKLKIELAKFGGRLTQTEIEHVTSLTSTSVYEEAVRKGIIYRPIKRG